MCHGEVHQCFQFSVAYTFSQVIFQQECCVCPPASCVLKVRPASFFRYFQAAATPCVKGVLPHLAHCHQRCQSVPLLTLGIEFPQRHIFFYQIRHHPQNCEQVFIFWDVIGHSVRYITSSCRMPCLKQKTRLVFLQSYRMCLLSPQSQRCLPPTSCWLISALRTTWCQTGGNSRSAHAMSVIAPNWYAVPKHLVVTCRHVHATFCASAATSNK